MNLDTVEYILGNIGNIEVVMFELPTGDHIFVKDQVLSNNL